MNVKIFFMSGHKITAGCVGLQLLKSDVCSSGTYPEVQNLYDPSF